MALAGRPVRIGDKFGDGVCLEELLQRLESMGPRHNLVSPAILGPQGW